MNCLIVGGKYHAHHRKTGFSDKGPWELYSVFDDKDKNEITVFITNAPTKMPDSGGDFVIKNIKTVKNGARKSSQGVWFQNVTIEAEVTYVEPDKSFDEVGGGTFDDIVADGNPWADTPAEEEHAPWDDVPEEAQLPF